MKAETKKRQTGGWTEEGLSSLLEEERRVGWHKMDVSVVMSQGQFTVTASFCIYLINKELSEEFSVKREAEQKKKSYSYSINTFLKPLKIDKKAAIQDLLQTEPLPLLKK